MDSPPHSPISSSSHTAVTLSPPPPPAPKKKPQQFMGRLILHSLEELTEFFKEIFLMEENSEEALNAERERKMRILMSLR